MATNAIWVPRQKAKRLRVMDEDIPGHDGNRLVFNKATVPPLVPPDLRSMPEMPHAGKHHGDPGVVGGFYHLIVADRTAGLNHGGGAGFDRDQ
jgi:hypothetical protein